MALGDFSPDLIISIAEHLEFRKDVSALARTARDIYAILNPYLYRKIIHHDNCSAVWWAARVSQKGTLQRFIDAGLDLSKLNGHQQGAGGLFHNVPQRYRHPDRECFCDPPGVIRLLAANGVDINAKNSNGLSPILLAALYGDAVTLMPLVDCGADVYVRDAVDCEGVTLLHAAALGVCPVSFVQHLVDTCGLDVNQRDAKGQNSLHYAARRCADDVIRFLVTRGVDVNAQDELGFAPAHFLVQSIGRPAPEKRAMSAFEALFGNGADVNMRNSRGKTPLDLGTEEGRYASLMEYLLKQGADVKAGTTDMGYTAIHLAVRTVNLYLVPLYVKYGGDINARDVEGRTPLHHYLDTDDMDELDILTELGADIHAKDSDGQSFYELRELKADQARRGVDSDGD